MNGERAAITRSVDECVEVWTMASPPVNAVNPLMVEALRARIDEAESCATTRAVVIRSELRVFSAGGDASWMLDGFERLGPDGFREEFIATLDQLRELCLRMKRSDLLYVAVIEGHALAGGVELAAACDLRFAARDAAIQIGVPEWSHFGLMPSGAGGVQYLTRILGCSSALHFILDDRPMSPERALEVGLVDVLSASDATACAAEFCRTAVRNATRVSIGALKRAVYVGAELPLYEALELDRSLHWDAVRRSDFAKNVGEFASRFGSRRRSAREIATPTDHHRN